MQETEKVLRAEVNEMMKADIQSFPTLTESVTFTRCKQSGKLGLGEKKDKTVS